MMAEEAFAAWWSGSFVVVDYWVGDPEPAPVRWLRRRPGLDLGRQVRVEYGCIDVVSRRLRSEGQKCGLGGVSYCRILRGGMNGWMDGWYRVVRYGK